MQGAGSKGKLGIVLVFVACLTLMVSVLVRVSSNHDLSWHVTGGGG